MLSGGLARIDVKVSSPFELFKEWQKEARENHCPGVLANTFNLATAGRNNVVSNRNVGLKEIFPDGFSICTDKRSKKILQIMENSSVAATFLFAYTFQNRKVVRQIRIEGKAEKMDDSYANKYYENQQDWEKARSNVCHQDKEVDHSKLKGEIDEMLQKMVRGEVNLPRPDHEVAYKIIPDNFDFYYAWDEHIADRVYFAKNSKQEWSHIHLAA